MESELLKQLYQRYSREIYLYLYALCQNPAIAEDLMQDTFLKALLSLNETHTNMKAWLYLVARNLFFNYKKKEKQSVSWEEDSFCGETGNRSLPEQLIESEKQQMLWKAMNRLSENKREILQLQYLGGFSQREIAAMLCLTPANVRVLALRARRELKKYLEENGYDIS